MQNESGASATTFLSRNGFLEERVKPLCRGVPREVSDRLPSASSERAAQLGVVDHPSEDGGECARVGRRDEDGGTVERLTVCGQVAEHEDGATGGRLHGGQAESFGERGK